MCNSLSFPLSEEHYLDMVRLLKFFFTISYQSFLVFLLNDSLNLLIFFVYLFTDFRKPLPLCDNYPTRLFLGRIQTFRTRISSENTVSILQGSLILSSVCTCNSVTDFLIWGQKHRIIFRPSSLLNVLYSLSAFHYGNCLIDIDALLDPERGESVSNACAKKPPIILSQFLHFLLLIQREYGVKILKNFF